VPGSPLPLAAKAAGHASSYQSGYRSPDQKRAGPTTGEISRLIEQISRFALFKPRGRAVQAVGRLVCELAGHASLTASGGHLTELVCDGMQLNRRLLLLGGRLVACLPLGLSELDFVPASRFSGGLPGLVLRGLGDLAARLAGLLATSATPSRATSVADGSAADSLLRGV
jgi:hypothetical protein